MSDATPPPPSPPRRPSDLEVERWRLGELTDAQAKIVENALRVLGDPRLESTQTEDQALFEQLPPREFAAEVVRRAELQDKTAKIRREAARERDEERNRQLNWLWAPVAVAAVLLLVVLIWSRAGLAPGEGPEERGVNEDTKVAVRDPRDPAQDPTVRIKGSRPVLVIRVKEGSKLRELGDQDEVGEGDVLQLSYVAGSKKHGVIVSIDGSGVVTTHLPSEPSGDTRLRQRKETPIGHSYELDDAPEFERFIFVASDRPLDPKAVTAAARKLARDRRRVKDGQLPLDAGLAKDVVQTSVLLRKHD